MHTATAIGLNTSSVGSGGSGSDGESHNLVFNYDLRLYATMKDVFETRSSDILKNFSFEFIESVLSRSEFDAVLSFYKVEGFEYSEKN
jgi:hypothetical protein